jgi:hypothetical protein
VTGLVHTIRAVDSDVVALQEVWGTAETSQAHEFGVQLGLYSAFAAPSLPPPPVPTEVEDHAGVQVGIGLLSPGGRSTTSGRWSCRRGTAHRHRSRWSPPSTEPGREVARRGYAPPCE